MGTYRFVHAADLHLDSPLTGLSLPEDAPRERFRTATRRALESLVTLCIEEGAAFLLLAGDLYDGDWKDYQTGLFFARQMARLDREGIRVLAVRGNHDAESVMSRRLSLPENVHVFGSDEAETVLFDELRVALHGRSYARRDVTEDLSAGYPPPVAGHLNIGLLHTAAEGHVAHEPYAPCRVADLAARGYDYWALGHVHERRVLCEAPWVVFAGNTQGRHVRETGAKGALLVTVRDGIVEEPVFRALDAVRWFSVGVDISDCGTRREFRGVVREALDECAEQGGGRPLAIRLRIAGRTPLHDEIAVGPEPWEVEVRELASEVGGGDLWPEKVRFSTRTPRDLAALREMEGPVGSLLRGLGELRDDPEEVAALAGIFEDLRAKLPPEVMEGPDGLDLTDPDTLLRLLEEVEQDLLPRLLEGGEE